MVNVIERNELTAADRTAVSRLHAEVYSAEQGWDMRFVEYVDHTLEEAAKQWDAARDRLWLAQLDEEIVGSIAIVHGDSDAAQLRWLVVQPGARGRGLGGKLVNEAVEFSRAAGYRSVFLLTTANLEAAARLYHAAGFVLREERLIEAWGVHVSDQRYELNLRSD